MQSNIFVKVAPLLKGMKFNIDADAVLEFLGRYGSKDFIYPNAVHRKLKIDIKIIYEILEICAENELVEPCLEIYCPICNRFTGECFDRLQDIPEQVYCLNCDEEVENPLKHAIVVYRVL